MKHLSIPWNWGLPHWHSDPPSPLLSPYLRGFLVVHVFLTFGIFLLYMYFIQEVAKQLLYPLITQFTQWSICSYLGAETSLTFWSAITFFSPHLRDDLDCILLLLFIQEAPKQLLYPVIPQFTQAFVHSLALPDSETSDCGIKMEVLKVRSYLYAMGNTRYMLLLGFHIAISCVSCYFCIICR